MIFEREPLAAHPPRVEDKVLRPEVSAWDVLEEFGLALQQCGQPSTHVPLVVEAVYDSLGAEAVYWCADESVGGVEQLGVVHLTDRWCRDFTARMRSEAPAHVTSLLRSFLDPGSKPMSPWPCSAALVRPGKTGGWLAALSFHPRRLFQQTDLKIMLLVRRMLLSHRVHSQRERNWKASLDVLTDSLSAALDALDEGDDTRGSEQLRDCVQKMEALRRR